MATKIQFLERLFSHLPPPVIALLLQIVALCGTWIIAGAFTTDSPWLNLTVLTLICGGLASALSYFAGLASWWLLIQFVFLPLLSWALRLDFSPTWFLFAFLALLTIYWSTFRTQVPLYLSSVKVWHALLTLLPPEPAPLHFVDLGSGLGGVLAYLAKARPDGHYVGIESAPLPCFWSWLRLRAHRNCRVRWASFWNDDLGQYNVVFAYLSPVPMEKLWLKAQKEMQPGSLFISSTFNVPDQQPHQKIEIDDLHHSTLLIWRMI